MSVSVPPTNRWRDEIAEAIAALKTVLSGRQPEKIALPSTICRLGETFGLSEFEGTLLLMAAALEIDGEFASEWGPLSFALALEKLPEPHWSAITPDSPLRRWGFVRLEADPMLTQSQIRIDEAVLHFILGCPTLDERLVRLLSPIERRELVGSAQLQLASQVGAAWSRQAFAVQLIGRDPASALGVATAAAQSVGAEIWKLSEALEDPKDRQNFVWLWNRHTLLFGEVLVIESEAPWAAALADRILGPMAIVARDRVPGIARSGSTMEVPAPSSEESRQLWNSKVELSEDELSEITHQFRLGPEQISDVEGSSSFSNVWDSARRQNRGKLEELAERIVSEATWSSLVIPEASTRMLEDIARHVRKSRQVYGDWGFGGENSRGLGITGLFSGPSGTGKTLAAEVLANELRLDLYRIDLSRVVSKYIGETEKNLRQIFDAAEQGGAVLLFDEADALFGKRSEVKDSHDRYANIEVSYLLQRMEQYRGLALLTTNLKGAFDPAFLRRIRFVVPFPFPEAIHRKQIWERVFPSQMPRKKLDFECLSQLNVTGGNIKNIALFAAFLASDEGTPVDMGHILRAAKTEYAKLERPLTDAEVRGWK
jgi:AAA+ superfamily predicted ATPase